MLNKGSIYQDSGAYVVDNFDGEVTIYSNIEELNLDKVGTYSIEYYYIDSHGNISDIVYRTIEVNHNYSVLVITASSIIFLSFLLFYISKSKKKENSY